MDEDLDLGAEYDAEKVAGFLLKWVRETAGKKVRQGLRKNGWRAPNGCAALSEIAKYRIFRLPEEATHGLFAWADGFPAVLLNRVLDPEEILAMQAQGKRCVSLVDTGALIAPHANPYEFLIHDLCHLSHFVDPNHYHGQVGFFAKLLRASDHNEWNEFEKSLDTQWQKDKDYVMADMNGSVVFLFASLKIRLTMAISRMMRAKAGVFLNDSPRGHQLLPSQEIQAHWEQAWGRLCDSFEMEGRVREAAMEISARRDRPRAASILREYFAQIGREQVHQSRPCLANSTAKSTVSSIGFI